MRARDLQVWLFLFFRHLECCHSLLSDFHCFWWVVRHHLCYSQNIILVSDCSSDFSFLFSEVLLWSAYIQFSLHLTYLEFSDIYRLENIQILENIFLPHAPFLLQHVNLQYLMTSQIAEALFTVFRIFFSLCFSSWLFFIDFQILSFCNLRSIISHPIILF